MCLVKQVTRDGVQAPLGTPHRASGQPGCPPSLGGPGALGRGTAAGPGQLGSSHRSHPGAPRDQPSAQHSGQQPWRRRPAPHTGVSAACGHRPPLPGHAPTPLSQTHQPLVPSPSRPAAESSLGRAASQPSCSGPRRDSRLGRIEGLLPPDECGTLGAGGGGPRRGRGRGGPHRHTEPEKHVEPLLSPR